MKMHLLVVSLVLLNLPLMAQDGVFAYHKEDDMIILKSDKDYISISPSTKTKSGTEGRLVTVNGFEYKFALKKNEAGKMQDITDGDGTPRATVLLYGDERYSILLPNGEYFKWGAKDDRHWAYQKNGQDVITAEYRKVHGQKQIEIQIIEPLDAIIPIIFLEHTSHVRRSGFLRGVLCVGLGVLCVGVKVLDVIKL